MGKLTILETLTIIIIIVLSVALGFSRVFFDIEKKYPESTIQNKVERVLTDDN